MPALQIQSMAVRLVKWRLADRRQDHYPHDTARSSAQIWPRQRLDWVNYRAGQIHPARGGVRGKRVGSSAAA